MDWTKTVFAVACVCALAAHGMPSQQELREAQNIVNEVMRSDVAAFNAGKKKPTEVADAALRYADEAQGEAARFLLLKGAFYYRMRAADYGGAMAVISQMRRDIADVPDETVVELLSGALRRVPRKHCGQLYDLLQRTQNRIRYTQEVEALAAKAKANPSDKAVRTALGEMRVLLGDWKAALPELAAGDGPAAKAAALEQKAKTGEAADAWWALAGTDGSDRSLAYRAHAVRLYRAAVRDGSLAGLKKTLAEKRIAEAKADGLPDEPEDAPAVAAPAAEPSRASGAFAASGSLYCVIDLSAGPNASRYPVKWLSSPPTGGFNTDEYKTSKLVLRRIEPGTFKMGGKQIPVTLTKPYYIGIFQMTQKQYELVAGDNPASYKGDMRPVEMVSYDMLRGKDDGAKWPASSAVDAASFIGKLRARTGIGGLDLPTEAQWEFACRAGTTSRYNNGGDSNVDLKRLGRFVLNQKCRNVRESDESFARHEPDGKGGCSERHTAVGSYLPNAWGLYDMHGNVWERCLDWRADDRPSSGTDPVGSSSGTKRVIRGGSWDAHPLGCTSSFQNGFEPSSGANTLGFRLSIGHDLAGVRNGGAVPAAPVQDAKPAVPATLAPDTKPVAAKPAAERPENLTFKLNARQNLEMQGIPAGTFEMGYKDWNRSMFASKLNAPRQVTISRPFWMSTTPVTVGQLSALRVAEKDIRRFKEGQQTKDMAAADVDRLAGPAFGETSAEEFLKALNRRFKNRPKGYVFRLPTSAEWEYAVKADGSDPVFLQKELGRGQDGYIAKAARDFMDKAGWPAEPFKRKFMTRYVPPALMKPNPWGLLGVAMSTGNLVLDTADMNNVTLKQGAAGRVDLVIDELKGAPLPDSDPVHVDASNRAVHLVRGWALFTSAVTMPRPNGIPHCFSVVLGPELGK